MLDNGIAAITRKNMAARVVTMCIDSHHMNNETVVRLRELNAIDILKKV